MASNVVKLETIATSYGRGPYHPALRTGAIVYYWPNITMLTEYEARARAQQSLDDVNMAIEAVTHSWNVWGVAVTKP